MSSERARLFLTPLRTQYVLNAMLSGAQNPEQINEAFLAWRGADANVYGLNFASANGCSKFHQVSIQYDQWLALMRFVLFCSHASSGARQLHQVVSFCAQRRLAHVAWRVVVDRRSRNRRRSTGGARRCAPGGWRRRRTAARQHRRWRCGARWRRRPWRTAAATADLCALVASRSRSSPS